MTPKYTRKRPNLSLVEYYGNIPDISTHRGFQTVHRHYQTFNPIRRVLLNRHASPKLIAQVYADLHQHGVAHIEIERSGLQVTYSFSWNKVVFLSVPQYLIMTGCMQWVWGDHDFQFGTSTSFVGFGMAQAFRPALSGGLLRFAKPVTRIKQMAYVLPTPKGEAILKAWLGGEGLGQNVTTQGFPP